MDNYNKQIIQEKKKSYFNPFMPSGLCYLNSLDRSFTKRRDVWLFLLLYFIEIPVFNANSVDPDQTPRNATLFANVSFMGP